MGNRRNLEPDDGVGRTASASKGAFTKVRVQDPSLLRGSRGENREATLAELDITRASGVEGHQEITSDFRCLGRPLPHRREFARGPSLRPQRDGRKFWCETTRCRQQKQGTEAETENLRTRGARPHESLHRVMARPASLGTVACKSDALGSPGSGAGIGANEIRGTSGQWR